MLKTIDELDHYEVLEVAREARLDDIERAFALVRAAYDGDALAAYSIVPPDEARLWRERIEEAWRVLSDPDQRRDYDAALEAVDDTPGDEAFFSGTAEGPAAPDGNAGLRVAASAGAFAGFDAFTREPAPLPEAPDAMRSFDQKPCGGGPLRVEETPPPARATPRELESFEESDPVDAPWDGPRLRRARLVRGLEIDQVSSVTKINPTYLRFLEEERFDDLPAIVYVRGFIAAYARLLGLDPARVAPSYVSRCEDHRGAKSRSRALGRR